MYILLKTNIYHIFFFFIFLLCESPDVRFHRCKTFGATLCPFFFFWGTILCYGISALEEEEMGQKNNNNKL